MPVNASAWFVDGKTREADSTEKDDTAKQESTPDATISKNDGMHEVPLTPRTAARLGLGGQGNYVPSQVDFTSPRHKNKSAKRELHKSPRGSYDDWNAEYWNKPRRTTEELDAMEREVGHPSSQERA